MIIRLFRRIARFIARKLVRGWPRFWMRYASLSIFGRIATRLATWFAPPYKDRASLARMVPQGYVAPNAIIYHPDLRLGANVFVDDRVTIFQAKNGGPIELGNRVAILRDTILETGHGGSLTIGADTWIHSRCQLNAYKASIQIGCDVQIAPNCAFYSYDHSLVPGELIKKQPLQAKGDIIVEDDVWIGFGVIVLSGVRIGKGAVIGAGAVVTNDIPIGAIAVGSPARVVKMRSDLG